ncbi:hypothetical protein [Leptolyngbya ectocarpi]|nr:hypothetical protein [Leptolyngbya ectocarpi]
MLLTFLTQQRSTDELEPGWFAYLKAWTYDAKLTHRAWQPSIRGD